MEDFKTEEQDDLTVVSMGVILHAGNARDAIFQAVDKAADANFAEADQLMIQASVELVKAHQAQTAVLQKEADGVQIPYSPLFGHAQDTLMTVKTEHNLIKQMIKLYKKIGEQQNG